MGERKMGIDMKHRAEWEKTTLRRFVVTLHRDRDKEMIEYLEHKGNVRRYLMNLIRKDMDGKTPKNSKDPASKDPTTTEEKESGKKARKEDKVQI